MSSEIPHDHTNETSGNNVPLEKTRIVDGVEYKKVAGPYSLRQYYSHSTTEAGPGPGWDSRMGLLDDKRSMERFGRTFTKEEVFNPSMLPDDPMYEWVPMYDDQPPT